MSQGFLGNPSTLMLDVVVCALVVIVPALLVSIWLAKRGRYALHRTIQLVLSAVLLLTVLMFEVDVQLVHHGWENIVAQRPVPLSAERMDLVRRLLWLHLVFAVSTPIIWGVTVALALRRFPNPPQPGPHSKLHKKLAWVSTVDIVLTAITGLTWYYFAFVS